MRAGPFGDEVLASVQQVALAHVILAKPLHDRLSNRSALIFQKVGPYLIRHK